MDDKKIRLGIPKGSLQEHTLRIFRLAGFDIAPVEQSYVLETRHDPEISAFLVRPQEIPKYIEEGKLDAGISGEDWILETRADVVEICDLRYAKRQIKKIKWTLAVHQNSKVKKISDLQGKTISTEIVNIVKDYLARHNVSAKVDYSYGATEVKPHLFVDAIVDVVETGGTLRGHGLREVATVFESSTVFIAGKKALELEFKKNKIDAIALLLGGAVSSEETVGIFMHVPKESLKKKQLMSLSIKNPTVSKVAGTDFYDVMINIDKKRVRDLIPELRKMGCTDIVEFPLNKFVL